MVSNCVTVTILQTFLVINSSKRSLCWALDISCACKALEEGVFKFLRKDGTPFLTFGAGGIRGTLEPCQSEPICVMFSPGSFSSFEKLIINDRQVVLSSVVLQLKIGRTTWTVLFHLLLSLTDNVIVMSISQCRLLIITYL